MTRKSIQVGITALALALAAGTCFAQNKGGDKPLRGPAVRDGGGPGAGGKFGDQNGGVRDRVQQGAQAHLFMRALNVLRGDQADESVRLSADQDAKIKGITDAFMNSMKEYRDQHKAEVQDLVKQLPPEERRRAGAFLRGPQGPGGPDGQGGPGGPPDGQRGKGRPGGKGGKGGPGPDAQRPPQGAPDGDMMAPDNGPPPTKEQADAARAKLKEIIEGAPKPDETQKQVWALLTDAQKPVVQKEMDRLKAEAEQRAKDGPGAGGDRLSPEMREKLKNMSPEERRKFMDEQRAKRRGNQPPAEPK